MNTASSGRTITISFSLDGNQGAAVLAGSPTWQQIDCTSVTVLGSPEGAAPSGKGGLRDSAVTDRDAFGLKTAKLWLESCRRLTVTLADGTVHEANFQFAR